MCVICASSLLDELNKKRNWRPDRVIKWAGQKGLIIDENQLKRHFAKHTAQSTRRNEEAAGRMTRPKKADYKQELKPAFQEAQPEKIVKASPKPDQKYPSDEQFFNEVISDVFRDLTNGKFELKIEHGFKAIELKHKIAENGNVENLLLKLLNEIRSQELAQPPRKKPFQHK